MSCLFSDKVSSYSVIELYITGDPKRTKVQSPASEFEEAVIIGVSVRVYQPVCCQAIELVG
jgi:hypothetical protein